MCMITYLPPFVKVPVAGITNGGVYNDDGHGWAVAAGTGFMLTGHYMDLEPALESFIAIRESYPEAPAVFHSRWATHGETTVKNVHPFFVGGKDTVVAHNGVLPATFHPAKGDKRSDTRIMANEWLRNQSTNGLWTRSERRRIGSLIGTNNKLAILSVSPKLDKPRGFLVNAAMGVWSHGAWFSNHDFEGWGRGGAVRSGWSSWWDDDAPMTARVGLGVTPSFVPAASCEWCNGYGTINAMGICRVCHTCQDCFEHADTCMCYAPKSLTTDHESDDDETAGPDRLGAALALLNDPDFNRRVRPYMHD